MKNTKITENSKTKGNNQGWPLIVYVWMVGLAFTGYIGGQFVFDTNNHPAHWLLGLAGLGLGCLFGWLWYKWRGDIKF